MLDLCALWVGGFLTKLASACLNSAVKVGHPVYLYTYYPVPNPPPGVVLRNARDILPENRMLRFRGKGSFALGSDIFRYELQRQKAGCWIDTDVFILRPIILDSPCLFGWEDRNSINSAVLYLKHDSSLLSDLLDLVYSHPVIPPWWPIEEQIKQRYLGSENRARPLEYLDWGVIGPQAVTYYAGRHNLAHIAKPTDVYYPFHWSEAKFLFDPTFDIDSHITQNTCAVHLWNTLIQDFMKQKPAPGSFMSQVFSFLPDNYPS
ncbi:MAG TPA: hypothetical protein VHP14_09420 [Anaerolineales bacterium]|nr:hypothetical protein [Anaerolineales bacterium]